MKKIILSCTLLMASVGAWAQNNLSLSEAISMGLKNNYSLSVQRNDERISEINNTWANTSLMPTLTLNVAGTQTKNYNDNDDYNNWSMTPQVTLNWTLFDGFAAQISKKKYEELEQQSAGNTALLVETTVQDIVLAYYNVLQKRELRDAYLAMSNLSKDRMDREARSKEIGASTSYDYLQYKTSYLADYSNYLRQKTTYENALRSLNYVLGIKDPVMWTLTTKLMAPMANYNLADLQAGMESSNKTLKLQYINQRIMALNTKSARSNYYPTLKVNGGVRYNDTSRSYSGSTPDMDTQSTDAYVGFSLAWTIFNGGTRQRAVTIAKINEESAQVQMDQMKHSLNNQLMTFYANYEVNKEVYKLAEEQIETAKLNLELSRQKYEQGAINSFNYRDVQNAYLNAVASHLEALYNLISAETDLLQISGNIVGYKQ